jgi:L-aspartate oxidase
MPLLTEALRGAGAKLVDGKGNAFMTSVHPAAELAPRDVVARAIWRQRQDGGEVFLDGRQAVGDAFPTRFPTVYRICRRFP